MDLFIVILLSVLAILLALIEIFLIPGITVAGFAALLFGVGAVVAAFVNLGMLAGWITMVSLLVGLGIAIWAFMHVGMDRIALKSEIDSTAPTMIPDDIKVGDCGVAITRLNPRGTVLIGVHSVEAKSITEWMDEETPVVVMRIEKTYIWVRSSEAINPKSENA